VHVSCDRHWSDEPRHHYDASSTTSSPTTTTTTTRTTSPRQFTASADVVVTSSAAVTRPLDEQSHVISDEDYDWSIRRTLERPPLDKDQARTRSIFVEGGSEDDENEGDAMTLMKEKTESLNTVKHWVNHGDDSVEPWVYRELTDDVSDEELEQQQDQTAISREHHEHHLEGQSDTVVHVHDHHIHEFHNDDASVVDNVEVARSSATATAALDSDQLASSVTQRTSNDDKQLHTKNDPSRARRALMYNVEEGLTATDSVCFL